MNKDAEESTIDVPRRIKKAAIDWVVPTILALIGLGFIALSRVQVQGMLVDYQTKEKAQQEIKGVQAQIDSQQNQISVYAKQVSDLQATLVMMDKKLDHLQYVVEFAQQNNRLPSPRAKDP